MEQNPTPLVSVIMPAYNAEKTIVRSVLSVCAQTATSWELIVIDDGSCDGTCDLVRELAQKDSRITLLENPKNMGVARTRNRGMDLARGQYVALLDSDDLWYPEKLEKQLALARGEQADIVYCSYAIVNDQEEKVCQDFLVPPTTDLKEMLIKSVISCSTVLLSRQIFEKYRFDEQFYHEDYVYWLNLLRDGWKAAGVTQVLAGYRITDDSRSSNKPRAAWYRWKIYRKHEKLSFPKSLSYMVRYTISGVRKYRKL